MTTTIAIAGKGGTGKTTLAGLLIRRLAEGQTGPILAIDADPASNLNTVLGLPLEKTVGDVREETSEKARANLLEAGIAKRDLLDYEINSSVVEGVGVDLLAMGRPEGPGCYCAANNMLRAIIDTIADSYPWVVIDNEAGLEHLSRRTTRDVEVLLIVSDATVRGITTAGRIAALLKELNTKVGKHYLIVNRAAEGLTPELRAAIDEHGLDLLAVLPDDPLVAAFDAAGRPLLQLPDDSRLKVAMAPVVDTVLDQAQGKEVTGAHHR
ncbi:MAG: AAA family ATPase [Actinobacteria bacterium]|nr:AAA family ATPase [Actinomycetota bacterium]